MKEDVFARSFVFEPLTTLRTWPVAAAIMGARSITIASAMRFGRSCSPWRRPGPRKVSARRRTASLACTAEIFAGLHLDPALHLQKTFTQKADELVLVKDIEFASCCEHHLLPFTGKATSVICRMARGRLSKLARVVDAVARRPQVQERMTEELADLVMNELHPRGVAVTSRRATVA